MLRTSELRIERLLVVRKSNGLFYTGIRRNRWTYDANAALL